MTDFVHEMESSNASHHVAVLERHIYHLQQILREWTPYVPQHVLVRFQIPLEITSSHLLRSPISQNRPVTRQIRPSLSGSPQSEETWRKPLRAFINRIPSAEKWPGAACPQRVSVLDVLFQSENYLRDSDSSATVIHYQNPDIMQTIEAYASFAKKCADDVKWAKLIASYQNFLLGALCHVASCLGVDPKSVNKMMGFISKGGPDHLQELRHGAAWGAEAIDRLQAESGWDIRSGDILFYFTPTFTSLRYWAKATQSISMFTDHLKKDQYKKSPASLHSNHLSVPCIIKCIFGKSVQFSDVCNALHCNFDIALESFAKWYLNPFGSDAMDELEKQRLFFPVDPFSPNRQVDFGVESQSERDSQPARDIVHKARKRRRVDSRTDSNLNSPSLNPNFSANVQVRTTSDEDINNFIPNLSDQERASLSRNPSPEDFPLQVTRDQQLLLVSPGPQYTVHGRQTACSLPQILQGAPRRSLTMMNDHYRPGGQVGTVRQTTSPAILSLGPSPSFTDHQPPLHFQRAAIGSLERDLPTSSGIQGSATGEMLNVSNAAVYDEVILPPIGRTGEANGLHNHLTTSDGSLGLHSSNQSFVGGYPSQYSTAGQGAQYAGVGEPQVVDTSLCSHNMLSSLLFEGQEGLHIDAEPQRIDTSLRSHYMLHDLLDQFEQSREQPGSDIPYQTQFTV